MISTRNAREIRAGIEAAQESDYIGPTPEQVDSIRKSFPLYARAYKHTRERFDAEIQLEKAEHRMEVRPSFLVLTHGPQEKRFSSDISPIR